MSPSPYWKYSSKKAAVRPSPRRLLVVLLILCGAVGSAVADEPTYFTAEKLTAIRAEARGSVAVGREGAQGWSKSSLDVTKVLRAFPALKLRGGFTLHAYEFKAGGNGNGVVWGMPVDAAFPEAKDCPTLDDPRHTPKPLDALDDVMEAMTGDDTAEAYMQASILRRQLKEFGAMWHGVSWGTHRIVDSDPMAGPRERPGGPMLNPRGSPKDWKWHEPGPGDWRPNVKLEAERAIVTFYTFSGYRRETITRHVDEYRRGKFRARVEEKAIAEGLPGYVF
jgi:hypothetical protein